MSERSDLRVRQAGEQGDDCVHHVLVINDAVLTLTHQNCDEVTKAYSEFLPLRS